MILKRRAALDGVQLDEIDPRILIQGIEPAAGKDNIATVSLWNGDGSRVTGIHRDTLEVVVKFSMDIKKNQYQARSELFERVMGWAAPGGWLELEQKPGRRLRVILAQLPSEGDPLEWTNRYSITFRAYGVPYWQQIVPQQLRRENVSTVTSDFQVLGNARTVAECSFENTSGSEIDGVTLSAGDSTIELEDLGLLDGETLRIDHLDDGRRCVLRIRIENGQGVMRSVLDKRTPESSDDLWMEPGIRTVALTADHAGTLEIRCAGRYL